jgi:hypothetical protein
LFCSTAPSQTSKDRYLFLFTDLLVIGKPILSDGEMPTLDHKFVVKSIVELPKLKSVLPCSAACPSPSFCRPDPSCPTG